MFAAWLHFNGELPLGDVIVGVGTLGLAWFTWQLARQTRREVARTDQGLELTRESIEAQDMPFVITTPQPDGPQRLLFSQVDGQWYFDLRLWNLGKGPAMVRDVSLKRFEEELLEPLDAERPVGSREVHDLGVRLRHPYSEPSEGKRAPAELRTYYRHASGTPYMTKSAVSLMGTVAVCRDYARSSADDAERDPLGPVTVSGPRH